MAACVYLRKILGLCFVITDQVISEGLSILNPDELKILSDIAERVLRNRLENLEQSYRICRLCCYEGCTNCPVDAELHERGVDREKNDDA